MRHSGLLIATLVVAMAAPVSNSFAENTGGTAEPFSTPAPENQSSESMPAQNGATAQPDSNAAVQAYEGADVYDSEGDKVANLKKIVKEPEGKANHAVLTVGSIFGFGGKDVRVPLDVIYVGDDGHLEVAMTEDELEEFPPVVETQ